MRLVRFVASFAAVTFFCLDTKESNQRKNQGFKHLYQKHCGAAPLLKEKTCPTAQG